MTPELDLLDQLHGGPMPKPIAIKILSDRARLQSALSGLLADGLIQVAVGGAEPLPPWKWKKLCRSERDWSDSYARLVISLTPKGTHWDEEHPRP